MDDQRQRRRAKTAVLVRPFFQAFFTTWDPITTGAGFEWGHLALVAAWGVAGLAIAMFAFRWEPRR